MQLKGTVKFRFVTGSLGCCHGTTAPPQIRQEVGAGLLEEKAVTSNRCGIAELISRLPMEIQARIKLLQENIGKTLLEIDNMLPPDSERTKQLGIVTSKAQGDGGRTGAVGKWAEHVIRGERGDNKSEPDLEGLIDVKCWGAHVDTTYPSGFRVEERTRLTAINFQEIQKQEFESSPLSHKGKMLVLLTSGKITIGGKRRLPPGRERRLLAVGLIDLEDQRDQMQRDFEYVRNMCKQGKAHELHSQTDQPCVIAKTNSSDTKRGDKKRIHTYRDEMGNICERAGGLAFYLFPETASSLFIPRLEK